MSQKKKYTTGQFAKKAKVSVRTIHYYHDKGLIRPGYVSESGYRYYGDEDLAYLQRILALKHLGFSLEEIRAISLNENDADFLRHSLELQLELVRRRMEHLRFMERSIQKTAESFEKTGEVNWEQVAQLIQISDMEKDLVEQYKNGENIKARIHLHECYAHNPEGWFPWVFDQIPEGQVHDVLEIGCGDGSFWKKNADRIPGHWKLTLTDVSQGMLEDASRNLQGVVPVYSYRAADAQKLPFPDDSFDCIIANHVLFYLADLQTALSEIARVLRPGGIFLCATYGREHMKEISEFVKEFDRDVELSRVDLYDCFGLENGKQQLMPYFGQVEKSLYEDWLEVTDVEPLLAYILSCHGNQRERLIPRYEEFRSFLEQKMKKNGSVHITKQAGVFLAASGKKER